MTAGRRAGYSLAVLLTGLVATCAKPTGPRVSERTPRRLTAFGSEAELASFLRGLAPRIVYAPPPPAKAVEETINVTAGAPSPSVTNVQHAGVDEGGIVKVAGGHLVVLRRGRLFTVEIARDALRPVDATDAFGPDIDPAGAWYDEMLASERRIVVVGYSYERDGTELGVFDLQPDGKIRYRDTYQMRSADYYSAGNYASRLIGDQLIFYTPLHLHPDPDAPLDSLPALRRWRPGPTPAEFRPIYSARRIYRPLLESSDPSLHTVTTCDLGRPELSCTATGVVGPPGRVFYVSPSAVYVWMTEWPEDDRPTERSNALLYRLPLDGSKPGALHVSGGPVDQFSFLEADGHLNVLVRAESEGDGMWRAGLADGDIALLRLPLSAFEEDVGRPPASSYRPLPRPTDEGDAFQNRFVGPYLLYGQGGAWWVEEPTRTDTTLVAHRYAEGGEPWTLRLAHSVDRIEVMGSDAVVVGTYDEDLHFSTIALADAPSVVDDFAQPDAAQGELRSHGFFYRPRTERTGFLGLPIRRAGRPGYEHLFADSAAILFLSNEDRRLRPLGELAPRLESVGDDGCRASCVDWYGNARPLFLGDRILALLGYELVEGELMEDRLVERRRASFAPPVARTVR